MACKTAETTKDSIIIILHHEPWFKSVTLTPELLSQLVSKERSYSICVPGKSVHLSLRGEKTEGKKVVTEIKLNKEEESKAEAEAEREKGKHLKVRQKRESPGTIKGDGGFEIMQLPPCGGDPLQGCPAFLK